MIDIDDVTRITTIVIVIAIGITIHDQGRGVDHGMKGGREMIEISDETAEIGIEIITAVTTVIVIGMHGQGLEVDHGTNGGRKTIEISDETAETEVEIITARVITIMAIETKTIEVVGIEVAETKDETTIDNQVDKISVVLTGSIKRQFSLIATIKIQPSTKSMNFSNKNQY